MTRDSSNKMSKKENVKRSNKTADVNMKKKKNKDSDSDDNYSDSENEEMNIHEFRKYVQKIFPSKHLSKKINAGESVKKAIEKDEEEEVITKKNKNTKRQPEESTKNKKKSKKNKKSKVVNSEDEEEEEEEEEYEDEYEDDKYGKKLNIIFTIGGTGEEEEEDFDEDEYDDDYEDYEDDDETEDEDEEVSTDEEEEEDDEDDEEDVWEDEDDEEEDEEEDEDDEENDEEEKVIKKKNLKKTKMINKKNKKEKIEKIQEEKIKEKKELTESSPETLIQLKELLSKNPKDKSIQKCIDVYEEEIKKEKENKSKKDKKQKAKNLRIFRKIIRDKNTMNDFAFYEKLEIENQKKLIKELKEINKITRIEKPYRMTLLESCIPVEFKAAAMKKINSLKYMDPGTGDFYKIKNWVDTFMRIPFTNYHTLPLSIEDGVDKCHEFMENAQKTLDQAVYGLNDAKMQIMQMLGQLLTNPKAIGTAIAIHGPPGTGKTSLVKEGISKILNRPFAFIALGGATDSSFLEGHGYTYEGSTWGKIVQILIDSKCMNPVIYFDELDKISDTPRGEEIVGILTHLTDTTQNSQFHDKYFAEINFDLSKCLFIFSYNDESKVNAILKDRMYRIKTKGYNGKEKNCISNNYLLPKICEQVKFNPEDIVIPDDVISHIIETHCNKEDGVRNLKRCLEIIYTKLNLYRLMKPGSNLFEGEMSLQVEFPFKVTKDIVDKLIKKETDNMSALWGLYV
jgi:ATP-dependent Lon protease